MLKKRQFLPLNNIDKHQYEKLTDACTLCSKLMDAATPLAPTLSRALLYFAI
jgi:hypothetical protein